MNKWEVAQKHELEWWEAVGVERCDEDNKYYQDLFQIKYNSFKNKVVVELGAGPYSLIRDLSADRKIVVEPLSNKFTKLCEREPTIEYLNIKAEDMKLEPNVADVVIALNMLNHCDQPVEVIKKIRYILNDEGLLYFVVHLGQNIDSKHLYCYNYEDVIELFKDFKFVKVIADKKMFGAILEKR